jgi:GNAT superfamily N-acetyltransferase
MSFKVKTIDLTKHQTPIEWAANEGWNPGLHDAEAFYATDPKGYFVGFLNDEPISCISAVSYDDTFGFLGFYIVKAPYRGQGYGLQTWKAALKHLPTQNIGLDGVVEQQDNYKKSGFKLAYRNIRYEGKGSKPTKERPGTLLPLSEIAFEKLLTYDTAIFPTKREVFLKRWIEQPNSLALGFVEFGELKGYGMVRKCQKGYKIGPLFADNENIAKALFDEFRAFVGEENYIYLDTPEPNSMAVKLAESNNMTPMFETARMYTKGFPDTPIEKVFGVTTFELG